MHANPVLPPVTMKNETIPPTDTMNHNFESRILFDVKQASELTSLGKSTLYKLIRSGELASIKIGKRRLIPGKEIDAFVERHLEVSN